SWYNSRPAPKNLGSYLRDSTWESADDGGLISYGASIPGLTMRAAAFCHQSEEWRKTADLPIEQPTKVRANYQSQHRQGLGLAGAAPITRPHGRTDRVVSWLVDFTAPRSGLFVASFCCC